VPLKKVLRQKAAKKKKKKKKSVPLLFLFFFPYLEEACWRDLPWLGMARARALGEGSSQRVEVDELPDLVRDGPGNRKPCRSLQGATRAAGKEVTGVQDSRVLRSSSALSSFFPISIFCRFSHSTLCEFLFLYI